MTYAAMPYHIDFFSVSITRLHEKGRSTRLAMNMSLHPLSRGYFSQIPSFEKEKEGEKGTMWRGNCVDHITKR